MLACLAVVLWRFAWFGLAILQYEYSGEMIYWLGKGWEKELFASVYFAILLKAIY